MTLIGNKCGSELSEPLDAFDKDIDFYFKMYYNVITKVKGELLCLILTIFNTI